MKFGPLGGAALLATGRGRGIERVGTTTQGPVTGPAEGSGAGPGTDLSLPAPSPGDTSSSVVVLRETTDGLVETGRVNGLGPGEQIRSLRWFDDLAIVVTFRQVDQQAAKLG